MSQFSDSTKQRVAKNWFMATPALAAPTVPLLWMLSNRYTPKHTSKVVAGAIGFFVLHGFYTMLLTEKMPEANRDLI